MPEAAASITSFAFSAPSASISRATKGMATASTTGTILSAVTSALSICTARVPAATRP